MTSYRLLEHTADLGIEVTASGLGELFTEALRALTDVLTSLDRVGFDEVCSVELSAPSLEGLLVDWLNEAIFLHETEGLVFARAAVDVRRDAQGWHLTAELDGEPFSLEQHGLKTLIKAATHHQLQVEQDAGRWRARVIFDL